MTLLCGVRIVTNLYVEVPGVVLIMRDVNPGVMGDNPLMQGDDCHKPLCGGSRCCAYQA
jgi:hypothetical protein